MTFLLGSVAFTVIALGFRLYDLPKFIGIAFGIPFLIISPMAAIKTKLGALNGPLWSVDCIWWNALVGGLILSLWALGHFAGRLEKKGIPRAE